MDHFFESNEDSFSLAFTLGSKGSSMVFSVLEFHASVSLVKDNSRSPVPLGIGFAPAICIPCSGAL